MTYDRTDKSVCGMSGKIIYLRKAFRSDSRGELLFWKFIVVGIQPERPEAPTQPSSDRDVDLRQGHSQAFSLSSGVPPLSPLEFNPTST